MPRNRLNPRGKNDPSPELTRAIKETRIHKGYTQHAFARHLQCDYVTVWRWEKGNRVPHRTCLVEMLKMAPPKHKHVFERYVGKTLEQVLYEEFLNVHGGELDPDWSKDPEKHFEGVYTALTERINLLRQEAKMGYHGAALSLVRLLETAMKETEEARRRR